MPSQKPPRIFSSNLTPIEVRDVQFTLELPVEVTNLALTRMNKKSGNTAFKIRTFIGW